MSEGPSDQHEVLPEDMPLPESIIPPEDQNVSPSITQEEQAISDAIEEAVAAAMPDNGLYVDDPSTMPVPAPDSIHVEEAEAATPLVEEAAGASQIATEYLASNELPQPLVTSPTDAPNRPNGRIVPDGQEHTGRWTRDEQERFVEGLEKYGKDWKKVAAVVETRTVVQVRTHAQKFQKKLAKLFEKEGEASVADFNGVTESVGARMRLRVKEDAELKRFQKLHIMFSTVHGGYGRSI